MLTDKIQFTSDDIPFIAFAWQRWETNTDLWNWTGMPINAETSICIIIIIVCKWLGISLWHTYRVRREQQWCQLPCTTADNRKRRLFCRSTTAQLPQINLRNWHSSILGRPRHSDLILVYWASSDSCNCTFASVYLCDIGPSMRCNCRNCEHSKCFRRCIDNFSAPR